MMNASKLCPKLVKLTPETHKALKIIAAETGRLVEEVAEEAAVEYVARKATKSKNPKRTYAQR